MKTLTYIILVIALMGTTPIISHRDSAKPPVQGTECTETLVIDLSKTLPSNQYQIEYERMLYPTVRIKTPFSTGSGVVLDEYILTAAHVVGDATDVRCEIWDLSDEITATVIITDTIKDLALIKPSKPLAYSAQLAPKDYKPYIFAPVWVVGCSLGLEPRPSYGHLCALCGSVAGNWEISAPILPGNSGGPVYDARTFEVIGIAVWIHIYNNQLITTMAGIVPITEIYAFLQSAGAIYGRHSDTDIGGQDADTPPAD